MLKTAVFAPIPTARTRTAAIVNPGALINCRSAKRKSWIIVAVRCASAPLWIQFFSRDDRCLLAAVTVVPGSWQRGRSCGETTALSREAAEERVLQVRSKG